VEVCVAEKMVNNGPYGDEIPIARTSGPIRLAWG